mmetsp:Transcript_54320/g.145424  ORF Transcript_54320/g.145424 Transcript_54320/m.145424 type:complete len:200 (+) Transcript_54320:86-685(+)
MADLTHQMAVSFMRRFAPAPSLHVPGSSPPLNGSVLVFTPSHTCRPMTPQCALGGGSGRRRRAHPSSPLHWPAGPCGWCSPHSPHARSGTLAPYPRPAWGRHRTGCSSWSRPPTAHLSERSGRWSRRSRSCTPAPSPPPGPGRRRRPRGSSARPPRRSRGGRCAPGARGARSRRWARARCPRPGAWSAPPAQEVPTKPR